MWVGLDNGTKKKYIMGEVGSCRVKLTFRHFDNSAGQTHQTKSVVSFKHGGARSQTLVGVLCSSSRTLTVYGEEGTGSRGASPETVESSANLISELK